MPFTVNGEVFHIDKYIEYHSKRFDQTLNLVRKYGCGDVIEIGGHPWAMTSKIIQDSSLRLAATVSAEEITLWSDAIPVESHDYEIETEEGGKASFSNYSLNIERTIFDLGKKVDAVIACEIIEHLTRSPHIMMLNINSWLKVGGTVFLTTPNGSQLENPFRVKAKMPAYRAGVYERHNYVFTMSGLTDLVEACGFEIVEANYWSPYRRKGLSDFYHNFVGLGPRYLKDKFAQTLCVVARKSEDRQTASRLPKCYAPSPRWERVDGVGGHLIKES